MIADYDRKNFTVAQATFPSSSKQSFVTILPPGIQKQHQRNALLSPGAIAGILVGAVILVVVFLGPAWWILRNDEQSQEPSERED